MEDMACQSVTTAWTIRKDSLVKAVAKIPLETVRAAITDGTVRHEASVDAEGGHFEWL